ncbi:MAG: TldD/PmbA family protein [Dehalococcoidia bacterium]|nr:TldD/PmbA family protein [Dehalococcoidia bacterium]
MRDLVSSALDLATVKGATFAEVRVVERRSETLEVKNGAAEVIRYNESHGCGVRVIVDGAWGFASTSKMERKEIEAITDLAVRIARASALTKKENVVLSPAEKVVADYRTPVKIDPFTVPLAKRVDLLLEADGLLREKGVRISQAFMSLFGEKKIFANTEGSYISQEIIECGGGIAATAVKDGEVQVRSYPNSFRGNFATAGYEFIESLDLVGNAPRVASQAVELLNAPQCPSRVTTLIIDGSQLALQLHESCGHPIELDRVFGTEASYAGMSFLTPEKLGNFRYGSEVVNIVADATVPGGLGTFGFDDEGVAAQRIPIVKEGIFVGYLTSRETAAKLNQQSNGAMRASGWNRIPLIRMTNINLEPGDWRLEDLIADTDDGIYVETNRSWSIDDKRLNFQFGAEIGWEIKNGKLGGMIKNPTYTGITPQFWGSCDAVCDKSHWRMWGTPNCGKGEPSQTMHVGHGTAPARFREIRVGVMNK